MPAKRQGTRPALQRSSLMSRSVIEVNAPLAGAGAGRQLPGVAYCQARRRAERRAVHLLRAPFLDARYEVSQHAMCPHHLYHFSKPSDTVGGPGKPPSSRTTSSTANVSVASVRQPKLKMPSTCDPVWPCWLQAETFRCVFCGLKVVACTIRARSLFTPQRQQKISTLRFAANRE